MSMDPHRILKAGLCLLTIFAVLGIARVSFTDNTVSLKTNFFTDSGGLLVQSPTINFLRDLAQSTALSVQYTLDRVSIPPYRGISAKPLPVDGITGASKPVDSTNVNSEFIKRRNEFTATLTSSRWSGTAYYSVENDYSGRLVNASLNHDFNQKNTNLSLTLGYGLDTIAPLGRSQSFTKKNILADAAITQTLSPATIVRFGMDASYAAGSQSNPYRTVFVAGQYSLEKHPQERTRVAGYVKLNTFFKPANASLWTEYRFYGDDWGVYSHTVGLKFYQNMSKRLLIRYRYRYYIQTAAYFYRKNYSLLATPAYFTDDYKLEPFSSHLFGFKAAYTLSSSDKRKALFERTTLELKYERFFTSNNFTANIIQFGLAFNY